MDKIQHLDKRGKPLFVGVCLGSLLPGVSFVLQGFVHPQ